MSVFGLSIISSICLLLILHSSIKGKATQNLISWCANLRRFSAFMFHWLIRLSVIFSSPPIGGFSPHALSTGKTKHLVMREQLECAAVCHTALLCSSEITDGQFLTRLLYLLRFKWLPQVRIISLQWSRRRKIRIPNMVRRFHFLGFLLQKVVGMVLWWKQWLMRGAWVSGILMKNKSNADLLTAGWFKSWSTALNRCERGFKRENNRRVLKHMALRPIITAFITVVMRPNKSI